MPGETTIGWTDASWNPVTGCSRVSNGCAHCYAETLSLRRGWTSKPWTAPNAEENVTLHPDRLSAPLSWKAPRRVFVNSMSDLFHPLVPDDFIAAVFDVMGWSARQHTYQVLTKRPERMATLVPRILADGFGGVPPANVWLGTSVEAQREADLRIPELVKTPAAVRFLSCEPLLGSLDLRYWLHIYGHIGPPCHIDREGYHRLSTAVPSPLSWVIAGGESGPGFRPLDLDWVRSLRDQCQAAGVPFFYKQGSSFRPGSSRELDGRTWDEFPETLPVSPQPVLYQAALL